VTYETYNFWLRKLPEPRHPGKNGTARPPEAIRELVLMIARETGWGYTRIRGELGKLGLHEDLAGRTIVNILKAAGLDPNARRLRRREDFFHAE